MRHYSLLDRIIMQAANALDTLNGNNTARRVNPAQQKTEEVLTENERQQSARLMRVNHAGEISAQALYQGQALTARHQHIKEILLCAATEENDHLTWCQERLHELQSHVSYLNMIWYSGSFVLGALAGLAGDAWSLGFLLETERQVVEHLQQHLQRLPEADQKSALILQQMLTDEDQHATVALQSGGREMPAAIKLLMRSVAKLMTTTAYWV